MSANPSERVSWLVHTSVYDGLESAGHETVRVIKAAIAYERTRSRPRTALITGLERELRWRSKNKVIA